LSKYKVEKFELRGTVASKAWLIEDGDKSKRWMFKPDGFDRYGNFVESSKYELEFYNISKQLGVSCTETKPVIFSFDNTDDVSLCDKQGVLSLDVQMKKGKC